MEKFLMNTLFLVDRPQSNRYAEMISENADLVSCYSESKLYFIAQREEVFLRNVVINGASVEHEGSPIDISYSVNSKGVPVFNFEFELWMGDVSAVGLQATFTGIISVLDGENLECHLVDGKDLFITSKGSVDRVFVGTCPDDILFLHWKKKDGFNVEGLDKFRAFTRFKLHYIGISRKDDSMVRLFVNAHKNRGKILSKENAFRSGAHISDEVMIFFFDISDLGINIYDIKPEDQDEMAERIEKPLGYNKVSIIEDAEKAFVKLLDADYNRVKFKGYPSNSEDGLSKEGLTRHGFTICDSLTFYTSSESFVGDKYEFHRKLPGNDADLILIDNHDKVELVKAEDRDD